MAKVEHFAERTIKFEGGYQRMAADPGNYCNGMLIGTNRGISAIAYKQYFGACPTVAGMMALTIPVAKKIFKKVFWDDLVNGDAIRSQWVANMTFQAAIGAPARLKQIREAINMLAPKYKLPKISTLPVKFTIAEIRIINQLPSRALFNTMWTVYNEKLVEINNKYYAGKMLGWFTRMDEIKRIADAEFAKANTITKKLYW